MTRRRHRAPSPPPRQAFKRAPMLVNHRDVVHIVTERSVMIHPDLPWTYELHDLADGRCHLVVLHPDWNGGEFIECAMVPNWDAVLSVVTLNDPDDFPRVLDALAAADEQ